ncbi:MAG: response regulator [Ferruginibacter sp.]
MPRILIVDDELDIILLLAAYLSRNGYEIQTAQSKKEFLGLLKLFKPDLVILDVMLGEDNGRDICKEIKAAEHKDIPVLLCSAIPEMLDNYEECHANHTLEKPFELSVLLETVRKLLSN